MQALADCEGFRLVQIALDVSAPAIVELTGEVPALGEPAALRVS